MVHIRYKHTASDFKIEIKGHAGYAEYGKDIVCAGASTICSMLLIAADDAKAHGEIKVKTDKRCHGMVKLCYRYEKANSRVRYIAELVIEVYRMLAEEYPDNIEIESD